METTKERKKKYLQKQRNTNIILIILKIIHYHQTVFRIPKEVSKLKKEKKPLQNFTKCQFL